MNHLLGSGASHSPEHASDMQRRGCPPSRSCSNSPQECLATLAERTASCSLPVVLPFLADMAAGGQGQAACSSLAYPLQGHCHKLSSETTQALLPPCPCWTSFCPPWQLPEDGSRCTFFLASSTQAQLLGRDAAPPARNQTASATPSPTA